MQMGNSIQCQWFIATICSQKNIVSTIFDTDRSIMELILEYMKTFQLGTFDMQQTNPLLHCNHWVYGTCRYMIRFLDCKIPTIFG